MQTFIIIGSTADLIAQTSIELEDTSNAIFLTSTIDRGITKALVTASQYIPNEAKVPVTLTASKDIDISGIRGLIKVIKAEYEIDQEPKEFHNVSKFADTVTMNIGTTPTEGDTAYLYCYLVHTPDTLTVQLLNKVPMLAAAYCGMNWAGDGRTQIEEAIGSVALLNASVGTMTARLEQSKADTASMRDKTAGLLSNTNDILEKVESTLNTALGSLSTATTAIGNIDISAELDGTDTALDEAIEDVVIARDALAANTDKVTAAITDVDDGIEAAKTALTSADELNNTITEAGNAESMLHSSATGRLNIAQTALSELAGLTSSGALLTSSTNVATGQLNIASITLSKARAIISNYANQASQYSAIGGREVIAANSYIAEARVAISEAVNAINAYSNAATKEIQIANGYLNQANGYAREISSKLNVANIISAYQKWGQTMYQVVIRELREMQKPEVHYTYPES